MKKIHALFLIILVLISCQKDHSTKIELTSDYFPLKVGNYWDFEFAGKYLVIEYQILNGKEYFEITNDNGTSSYYVNRDNKIYVRDFALDNKEEMKFDLTAETNATWTYGAGSVTLASRNATIKIGDLQLDNCLQFNFFSKNLIDYGSSVWLAPGIGLIQQTCQECFGSAFKTMKLIKANINNQEKEF